jgi:hypothetical protein
MPKINVNYSKTIMYKICCNDLNITDIYVGHTTNFIKRKSHHKYSCNNSNDKLYSLKVYQFIRENGGWTNWCMIKIEDYPCNSLLDATKRERELYEELNATLNICIPSRTNKQWIEDNKDKIKEQTKEYYNANKDKIRDQMKEYREINKDIIKEYRKEYYDINIDKIKEYFNIKCECCCGGKYSLYQKKRHEKTNKHLNYINSLNV